jgi:hypothetical protein
MKKSNVRTIIRQIVREEVAMAINEVITELKQPSQQVSKQVPKQQKKSKIVEKKQFSSNNVINDILNETAQKPEKWDSLGGGTFDSSRMGEIMSKQYEGVGQQNSAAHLAASVGANPSNPPDFLTKNYSEVLQAMDKKAKQTRG